MRPVLPYSNHFLRIPYQKGGSGLDFVVQSLPPVQFTVTNTVAVLDRLELMQEGAVARYGPGGSRWMSPVGDSGAMYDEIDPVLACEDLTPARVDREGIGLVAEHVLSWWSCSMGKSQYGSPSKCRLCKANADVQV